MSCVHVFDDFGVGVLVFFLIRLLRRCVFFSDAIFLDCWTN